MKILEINEKYSKSGGQGQYFFELIEALEERGHEVYSCGFADKEEQTRNKLVLKDTKIFFIRQLKRFTFDFSTYFKLRHWIKKINPKVIHLHGINKSTLSILIASRGYKTVMSVQNYSLVCPTIWCVHQDDLKVCEGGIGWKCVKHKCIPPITFLIFYFHFLVRNYLLKKSVKLLPSSKTLQTYLIKHGFKNVKYHPNFIEIEKIKDSLERIRDIDLLYIGRFDGEKGIKSLIRAMRCIVNDSPKTKLYIVGDGPNRDKLEDLTEDLDLKNSIVFTGSVPFSRLKEYYGRAKVFVIPSLYMDNSPLVVFYAMVNGVPIVGSDRGGIPEYCIHNKTGLIFKATNVDDLYHKIMLLLNDPNLRKKLGDEGGRYVRNFEKKVILDSFLKKIQDN